MRVGTYAIGHQIRVCWLLTAPDGYRPVGVVVTATPEKPPLDEVRYASADFTDACEAEAPPLWSWSGDRPGRRRRLHRRRRTGAGGPSRRRPRRARRHVPRPEQRQRRQLLARPAGGQGPEGEGQEGRPRQREGVRAPVQVKPMLGGMATDLAMWFFYPLNGPARARVLRGLTIPLGGMPASAPTSATGST